MSHIQNKCHIKINVTYSHVSKSHYINSHNLSTRKMRIRKIFFVNTNSQNCAKIKNIFSHKKFCELACVLRHNICIVQLFFAKWENYQNANSQNENYQNLYFATKHGAVATVEKVTHCPHPPHYAARGSGLTKSCPLPRRSEYRDGTESIVQAR